MSTPTRHSDPSSIVAGDRTFYVTSSILGKRSLLQSDRAAELFIDVLYHYRQEKKYQLHEFVVMPDHFHLLITVNCTLAIEKALQLIKGGFAFRAGKELGFHAPVWQKGFSEIRITDAAAYLRTCEYIHMNPVKQGLAAQPSDYAHSSANAGFELDAPAQRLKPVSEGCGFGIAKAMP